MPSLIRFLTVVGVLAGLVFGGVFALATFVTPRTREMTVTIPASKLRPQTAAKSTEPKSTDPSAEPTAVGPSAAASDGAATR